MTRQLTITDVAEWLRYEPETGYLYWIKSRSWRTPIGSRVEGGSGGYITVYVCGQTVGAHRIAFLFAFGRWPESDIDHVNCNRHDNRQENLREATKQENARNRKKHFHTKSGFKGVYFRKNRQRWVAVICIDGRNHHLGSFSTAKEANSAYEVAAIKNFGEFARAA